MLHSIQQARRYGGRFIQTPVELTPIVLTPASAPSTWTANPGAFTVGVVLAPASAISTWTADAGLFDVTGSPITLVPASAISTWTANAGLISFASDLDLTPDSAVSTWTAGFASFGGFTVTITPASAVTTWRGARGDFGVARGGCKRNALVCESDFAYEIEERECLLTVS